MRSNKQTAKIGPEEMQIFVAIGRSRTLTEAAASLELPLHSVSRALKRMEQAADLVLVLRGNEGIRLTSVGRQYLNACREVLSAYERATDVLIEHRRAPEGTLQIGTPVLFARSVLAEILYDFRAKFPQLTVQLSLYSSDYDQEPKIIHDVFLKVRMPNDSRNHLKLFPAIRQGLFASPAYIAKRGKPAHPLELEKFDCLGYSLDRKIYDWNFTSKDESLAIYPPLKVIAAEPDILCRLAVNSVGVTILPQWLAYPLEKKGLLISLLEEWTPTPVNFCALYRGRLRTVSKEGVFLTFLSSILGTAKDPRCQGFAPERFFVTKP